MALADESTSLPPNDEDVVTTRAVHLPGTWNPLIRSGWLMAKKKVLARLLQFHLVAWGGTLVNLGVMWLLKGRLNVHVILAGALGIETAIVHNFTWHYFFTWRDRVDRTAKDYFLRLVRYNLVTASIDFVVNLGILWALTTYAGVHYLVAHLAGMLAGPVFKFFANEFLIFRRGKDEESREEGKACD